MKNHSVVPRKKAKRLSEEIHRNGKKLVFTNGCFDILHMGHVKCLEEAKSLGDVLIVGINTDRSARLLKGLGHPIVSQFERAKIVSSLFCVDYVIIFDERTPIKLISELRPDIHVKGGNYKVKNLPEYDIVTSYGGSVRTLSYVKGRSSSNIVKQIIKTYTRENRYK